MACLLGYPIRLPQPRPTRQPRAMQSGIKIVPPAVEPRPGARAERR